MVKRRRWKTERPVKEQLSGGRDQKVLAPDDLGDVHGRVIHHHRQLISRNVIVAPENEIPKVPAGDQMLRAHCHIGEFDGFAVRNPEAPAGPG